MRDRGPAHRTFDHKIPTPHAFLSNWYFTRNIGNTPLLIANRLLSYLELEIREQCWAFANVLNVLNQI